MTIASRYLLDTNTASFIIKRNVPAVHEHLRKVPISRICISAITQAELLFGVAKKPEAKTLKAAVDAFIAHVTVLPWDEQAAVRYADVRASLERKGLSLGNMDLLIAAHTLATDATLVTNDQAFKNVTHLKTVDWTKS